MNGRKIWVVFGRHALSELSQRADPSASHPNLLMTSKSGPDGEGTPLDIFQPATQSAYTLINKAVSQASSSHESRKLTCCVGFDGGNAYCCKKTPLAKRGFGLLL